MSRMTQRDLIQNLGIISIIKSLIKLSAFVFLTFDSQGFAGEFKTIKFRKKKLSNQRSINRLSLKIIKARTQ